jgi:hypothetical protein
VPIDSPLLESLCGDGQVLAYLTPERVRALLDAGDYVGDAPERARHMANDLRSLLSHRCDSLDHPMQNG